MEIKLKVQGYFVYLKKKNTSNLLVFNIAFEFDTTMSFVDMFQR